MPGWDQAISGARLYSDTDPTDLLLDDVDDQPLLSDSELEGWYAAALAKTAAIGEWAQDASWEATAAEEQPGAAGWAQDAATWDAAASLLLTAEATFEQIAAWEAEASSAVGGVTGSGAWSQSATWAASGSLPVEVEESEGGGKGRWLKLKHRRYIDSASFGQVSAWSAEMNVKAPRPDEVEELVLVGAI